MWCYSRFLFGLVILDLRELVVAAGFVFANNRKAHAKISFISNGPRGSFIHHNDRPCRRYRPLSVYSDQEADIADMVEQMVGGERFEMSELPDSMMDTTLFVGNLCEFVNDNDLSELFRSVSSLQSVPACVVRKADMTSRQFGFVSFPTVQEKEVRGRQGQRFILAVARDCQAALLKTNVVVVAWYRLQY